MCGNITSERGRNTSRRHRPQGTENLFPDSPAIENTIRSWFKQVPRKPTGEAPSRRGSRAIRIVRRPAASFQALRTLPLSGTHPAEGHVPSSRTPAFSGAGSKTHFSLRHVSTQIMACFGVKPLFLSHDIISTPSVRFASAFYRGRVLRYVGIPFLGILFSE